MKKVLIAFILILFLPGVALSQVYFIAEKDGHIYNQPDESSLILANFIKGQVLEWRTIRTPENWVPIRAGNISGYARRKDGKTIRGASNPKEALQIYHLGYTSKEEFEFESKMSGFPENIRILIKEKKIKVGMTDEQVRLSWGEPDRINRNVGSYGVTEQWVYGDRYLYFKNGVLTSYQSTE